jgi:hypothetical protein
MADQPFESGGEERMWDEYDWERFLQQQDHKTEKYMELLEKYLDDPNRDQIIAREMGWNHLRDENGKDWSENLDALFAQNYPPARGQSLNDPAGNEEAEDEDDDDFDEDEDEDFDDEDEDFDDEEENEEAEEPEENYNCHPLYQAASALTIYIDQLFDERDPAAQHPGAVRLTTSSTLANVKLAAALSDDDVDEIGMTIAYLKRALKAITNALDACALCRQENLLDHEQATDLKARIFQVRDGIILLMGHYRNEWRRRHGQGH